MNNIYDAILLLLKFDSEIYSIIGLTLLVTTSSVILVSILAIPTGIFIGSTNFFGKKIVIRIINTFMGLPPVVAGLIVYMVLSNSGIFGKFQLLFTPTAMIIAQGLIVFPIITGLTITSISHKKEAIWETGLGLGLSKRKNMYLLLLECKKPIATALLAGYGRAISEVGAIILVGGNIQYHTRVMTTAILLETGKGNYDKALAIGIILLFITFVVNWIFQNLMEQEAK
jgi:tungstate transport system permease protein